MNSHKTTNALFALIIAALLVTSMAGLAAASDEAISYVAGVTWYDINGNGTREADEPAAPNIPVYMRPLGGEAGIAGGLVVFSDGNGLVDFGPLEYGEYQVQVNNGEPFTVSVSEASSSAPLDLPVSADEYVSQGSRLFLPLIIR